MSDNRNLWHSFTYPDVPPIIAIFFLTSFSEYGDIAYFWLCRMKSFQVWAAGICNLYPTSPSYT